mgnify:CR=1 FL=1
MVCRITATLLIPDPLMTLNCAQLQWIWDQSLLTVEINTITRWAVKGSPNVDWKHAVNPPRSIVTDHYLLDQAYGCIHIDSRDLWVCLALLIIVSVRVHQRPNLAFGISLYVSDDPQGSNVCNTMVRRVPWSGGATGTSLKLQAASAWQLGQDSIGYNWKE